MNLLDRMTAILRREGPGGLLASAIRRAYVSLLRPILPNEDPILYAGIPVGLYRKGFDRRVPGMAARVEDRPDYEEALIRGLRDHVRLGDRVVVVGGGVGVTACAAALAAGSGGHVTCFEGSSKSAGRIRETARFNNVDDRLRVENAVVGEAIHVYGPEEAHKVVPPSQLPPCDVLELDCEGAETKIIREMAVEPRVILVECHGLYGAPTSLVKELLRSRGYEVQDLGVADPSQASFCEANDIMVVAGTRISTHVSGRIV